MTCISEICPLNLISKQDKTNCQTGDYQIKIYSSADQLPYAWDVLSNQASVFLQKEYLEALEQAAPNNYQFFYLTFQTRGKTIGIALAHYFPFSASQSIRLDVNVSKWQKQLQQFLLKRFNWNFLVLGNSTLTGEYGTYFLPNISEETQFGLLLDASEKIPAHYGITPDIIVSKDWYADKKQIASIFANRSFQACKIQPNMILPIQADWHTFEHYLADMRSKYRVRVKRAFKKLGNIKKYVLNADQIKTQEVDIHRLYRNIANEADLNVAQLPPHYFYTLKKQLGNKFQLFGYYDGDELIGFCTTIHDGNALEAHFLGLEEKYNASHQLYLNMLLDMVRSGIEQHVHELTFSRTALEIKSSIGAVPYDMFGFIKHKNPIINRFVPFLFRFFGADTDWVQRHPFKESKMENILT